MGEYHRNEPFVALCGLNCCLCPRYHTEGPSQCPGCGGSNFAEKHPTCAVITCSKKHKNIEFCFECEDYPCKKYSRGSTIDSFISYKNVSTDMAKAKQHLKNHLKELKKKHGYLTDLIRNYNDGKSKGFYCLAANLLPLDVLTKIMKHIDQKIKTNGCSSKDTAREISKIMKDKARELGIEIALRK